MNQHKNYFTKNPIFRNVFLSEERANLSGFRICCSICACLVLSVPRTSFWCLGRAAVFYCGTPYSFLLPFLGYQLGYEFLTAKGYNMCRRIFKA